MAGLSTMPSMVSISKFLLHKLPTHNTMAVDMGCA